MTHPRLSLPPLRLSLSARLLMWTVLFVMLAEVFIYVPSISRYRKVYLEERLAEGHLATLVLEAAPDSRVPPRVEHDLLEGARVTGVELWRPDQELMLGGMSATDATFDLQDDSPVTLIREAFATLFSGGERHIKVSGPPPRKIHNHGADRVTVFLDEMPLWEEMVDYSWRILTLSIMISLITASLLYLTLQWGMIRPMRHITLHLVRFRKEPENPEHTIQPSGRTDELGVMEKELQRMQGELRSALAQKERLALLGDAVSRINHDLRNILSTVGLLSERLQRSDDPAVQKVAPMLATSVDQAVQICTSTVDLARGDQAISHCDRVVLHDLVDQVGTSLGLDGSTGVNWHNRVPTDLVVEADHDRLFRVFLNLGRNADKALAGNGNITVSAEATATGTQIQVQDDGPGLPDNALYNLFEPFAGASSRGGTGLGLTTARDLMRAHGGELSLRDTSAEGTCFQLDLPDSRDRG